MNKLTSLFLGTVLSSSMLPGWAADPPKPYGAVPTPSQVNWQRMEFYGFIHFGLNTFTGREWGYGDENPKIFNPTDFNASDIVSTFKKGGMKGMIYTAKHHDGFCAWPTKSTDHNITKSPWKNGKGDVVKEFALACKKHGIKFGTYLSPWDRNNADYGKEGYLDVYYKQIRELLTNYGPVFEIWFDGANGGDGYYGGAKEKRNIGDAEKYYNFEKIVEMIRKIQPNCIIWGAGHYGDARWGGSEKGHVNYPHWSTVGLNGGGGGTGKRGGERWVPAEGDTTINHSGWFWHQGQASRVKSPEELMQVWFDSVGRGANLILNVAADKTGKLDPADVKSLMEFKELRDKLYARDYALGATVTASQTRGNDKKFAPSNMTDGNMETYWAVEDDNLTPTAFITLPKPATFDVIRLREQIRLGQRVDSFNIDAFINGKWVCIDNEGKTIGNQVMRRLNRPITAQKLRLRITGSQATPCISEFSLFRQPAGAVRPSIFRRGDNLIILADGKSKILYTTDGSEPKEGSPVYSQGAKFAESGTVKARCQFSNGKLGPVSQAKFGISKTGWKVKNATSGNAAAAIDDNPETSWFAKAEAPQSFVVDMGKPYQVSSFSYLPRQDGKTSGMTDKYQFEVSPDGKTWTKAAEGEFSNLRANPIEQSVNLKNVKEPVRYFRFTGTNSLDGNSASAAEINVFGTPAGK
ncbi:alpha-L-fucosidase [Akkermansia massiliensis]|uniref:alpha-L-fucosidase n=1 Tax=Akkermansia massiliensis TaxID=2927224 RepID=UPI00202FAF4E|nr:alpha-L-fucosidase [Akkermansia sp. B2-R-115]MCM0685734.1 alpha-L-fucosidase [Akkermansia sp. B2-R-115]